MNAVKRFLLAANGNPQDSGRPLSELTVAEEPWFTWANLVTFARTLIGLAIFTVAAIHDSPTWNFIGLGVYWILDIADGNLARLLKEETRLGAQMDILSDRLLGAFFYFNYIQWHPEITPAVALFMLQFMFFDHYLSNQFMRWPIMGPNYFHLVDRKIWVLNWCTPAKFANGNLMTLLLVFTDWVWIASGVSIVLSLIKLYSIARLLQLPTPEVAGWRPQAEQPVELHEAAA